MAGLVRDGIEEPAEHRIDGRDARWRRFFRHIPLNLSQILVADRHSRA